MPLTRAGLDITDRSAIAAAVAHHRPAVIVNAAGYTAVDRAETEPEIAAVLNTDAPGWLAEAAALANAALIHFSTDYVFSGVQCDRAWREDDPVGPLSVYGATKEAGERRVRAAAEAHVILRTAWVFGARGTNFARTMIRLASTRPVVRVVADQHGTPTSAAMLADAVMIIAGQLAVGTGQYGTFHLTNAGRTTWYGFAERVFAGLAQRGLPVPELEAITTGDYPTPARRPAFSVLDCTKVAAAYGITPAGWQAAVDAALPSLLEAESA